ncbi:hypothetical protein FJR38_04565 [Anabaena sp. UHCC 0253]|uniref:hypothetical protein n=1 Tax=Anabaena sp. UHCC 0253 TaxID=2590019 RepID=UPI001445B98C|nr:hypothetical protein [Anabaena sp. UHCC 0253]MTJ51992.1 hypothetical protein [Anabaena sp. UHCC 0253]
MLKHFQILALVNSSIGILALNFALPQSASAAIVCEPGTINNYSNGSLASCILGQDTTLQVSTKAQLLTFPCQTKNYISFDANGQFTSCRLSEEIQIRRGNSLQQCPKDYWVKVSQSVNGNISVTCQLQY